MQRKRSISIVLAMMLLASACTSKPTTTVSQPPGDKILKGAKTFGLVLATAIDEGINLEAQLASDGTIDADAEPKLRAELANAKIATADFNLRISKYSTFDETSKADIGKFLNDAVGFLQRANDIGLLKIKNPQKKAMANAILASCRVAVIIFQAQLNE